MYVFQDQSIILLAVEHNLYKRHWDKSLEKKLSPYLGLAYILVRGNIQNNIYKYKNWMI